MAKFNSIIKTPAFVVALAVLSACATTNASKSANNGQSLSPQAQLYADYVSARYASNLNDASARADYFSKAFARRPKDIDLGQKALASAINNGDNAQAHILAIEVLKLDEASGSARAVLGVDALSKRKYEKSITYLTNANAGIGVEIFNSLMRGWAQIGMGDTDSARLTFGSMEGGKYFEFLGKLQNAIISMREGEMESAESLFVELDEVNLAPVETVLAQARGFMALGEKDKALEKLNAYAKANNGALTGPVRFFVDAIEADKKMKWTLTPAQSASRALSEPAFRFFAAQQQYEPAEIFLRLALELDPKNDKARLFLGSVLEEVDRKEDALAQYAFIEQLSPYTVSARLSEADIFFSDDKYDAGIKILESIQASHPSRVTQSSLGRAYLIMEDYAQALPYYEALIKDMSEEELQENTQVLYLRGICLERLGRWEEAVTDFEFVLKYKPENADALNYLGYTWVDKGVNLGKAFKMIEKAVELEPTNGAIIDSLGWAHYKLGRYKQARIDLENAAERSPTSATIIDHLGDVYWKLGRKKEAGYQWERAATLDPTDTELLAIKAKLKDGLIDVKEQ